jgi:hypothetical protein
MTKAAQSYDKASSYPETSLTPNPGKAHYPVGIIPNL